ncbi:carbonic anhydrase 12-like [Artemia franciscana]|uniref:Carbonic anhydrase n=1 Tax=Artemia franciscana TaxID=6661 RepID=A0AA88HKN9_ARTSF|nr:hypothetical protein QYM36_013149 [Artemia franciscana]
MIFIIIFCTALVTLDPVNSFFMRPFGTILKERTIITTQTVAPTCYELAEDFSVCGRQARQYGFDTFGDSIFHAYNPTLEYDNYNYYQIQPSFGPSNGRGNYRFLTGGIKGILMSKETSMNYVTVRETSGQTQRATIHCLNPGERLPQHMCARNPCVPNPCTRNGDKRAKCKVQGAGSYSCKCSGSKFFSNGISCVGKQQSPVDIKTADVMDKEMPDLIFTNYDSPLSKLIVENTGKSAQASVALLARATARDGHNSDKITVGGADLNNTYEFEQFHFHWDLDSPNDGSEHKIDGKGYPSEVHFVHRNTKYDSVKEALKKRDGLAVIAVLFKEAAAKNEYYDEFFSAVPEIKKANSKKTLEEPDTVLANLLPEDTSKFYRYRGSLTTKPFTENVQWIVMHEILELSGAQLEKFGKIQDPDGNQLRYNDREIQPIRDREIFNRIGAAKQSAKKSFLFSQNSSDRK